MTSAICGGETNLSFSLVGNEEITDTVALIEEGNEDDVDTVIEHLYCHLADANRQRRIFQWQYEKMLGFLGTARNMSERGRATEAYKRCTRVLNFLVA